LSRIDQQSARAVHEALVAFARRESSAALEVGRLLLEARRAQVQRLTGAASFEEYVQTVLGYKPKEAEERMRVARKLEWLPRMTQAVERGDVCWSAARELTRVATRETEAEWLGYAERKPVRLIEQAVAGLRPGDKPGAWPSVEQPRRVSFEVSAPTWALVQEVQVLLTRDRGRSVTDDELVSALARSFLELAGGADTEESVGAEPAEGRARGRDPGRSAYQIAICVCDRCKVATQRAGAQEVVVERAVLDHALCDAQHLGSVDSADPQPATQSIPHRIRTAVVARHGKRCAVPGCSHAAFIEVHHIDRRADGGGHDPERLIVLCGGHHTAVHEGTLWISGTYSEGFRFEHADGRGYGDRETDPELDALLAVAHSALVNLGYKHREAQAMVAAARPHMGPGTSQTDAVTLALRAAPPLSPSRSPRRSKSRRRRN
jgi:hypothetical protein